MQSVRPAALLQGKYGTLKTLPTVPGWEGAGTVVASGGGLYGRWLVGKRVACALRGSNRDGTWAEYFRRQRQRLHSAESRDADRAGGQLHHQSDDGRRPVGNGSPRRPHGGRSHCRRQPARPHDAGDRGRMNYPLINLVRRDAQAELLKSRGAKHVINTSRDGFADELKSLCEKLKATAAFEAIAGDMTGIVLNAMPPASTVYLYGALSETPCGSIDPIEVVFHKKIAHRVFLGQLDGERGTLGVIRAASQVQRMLIDGRIETTIQRRLSLDEVVEGLQQYAGHMTDGKVLIMPHGGGECAGDALATPTNAASAIGADRHRGRRAPKRSSSASWRRSATRPAR